MFSRDACTAVGVWVWVCVQAAARGCAAGWARNDTYGHSNAIGTGRDPSPPRWGQTLKSLRWQHGPPGCRPWLPA